MNFIANLWQSWPLWLQTVLIALGQILAVTIVVILCVAYLTLAERKVIGYMQARLGPNRVGPKGLLQPFADVLKLLIKEVVVPAKSNRFLFVVAPLLALTPAFAAWAVISLWPGFTIAWRGHRRSSRWEPGSLPRDVVPYPVVVSPRP